MTTASTDLLEQIGKAEEAFTVRAIAKARLVRELVKTRAEAA